MNIPFLKQILFGLLLLVITAAPAISKGLNPRPIQWQDIWVASQKMDVPFSVLILLLHLEDGYVGLASPNDNGTFDYGPFQINSIHLKSPEFKAAGITSERLQYDGPTNALAAAWYFKKVSLQANSMMDAVGRYHSRTPRFKAKYQLNFLKRTKSYKTVEMVIDRANRGMQTLVAREGE